MSKITKADYTTMTDNPDKVQIIAANTMQEAFVSTSLLTLRKGANRVRAQFGFEVSKQNAHPLTHVFLVISGNITGSYTLKPPIKDITVVSALNVNWEI